MRRADRVGSFAELEEEDPPQRGDGSARAARVQDSSTAMKSALPALVLLGVASAAARTVPTGKATDVEERAAILLLWVLPAADAELRVTFLGGTARPGEAVDLVDERGYIGRASIVSVDALRCGVTPYLDARVRPPRGVRRPERQMLALYPALARPARARLLRPSQVADPPPRGRPSLQAVDVDGDGTADVARYVLYHCDAENLGEAATCVETWNREDGRWRLVSSVDFRPPCK